MLKKYPKVWLTLGGLATFLLFVLLGFVVWASDASAPAPEAMAALNSTDFVRVQNDHWAVFTPITPTTTGLIFYPGGKVDYRAYAPQARAIAEHGYVVVIVPMPLNLAVFGLERATDVIAAFPQITHWAIGGHSLGGAMASQYVFQNPGRVQGLALWAAYPAEGASLAQHTLEVVSIYGTRDGVAAGGKIDASRALLPTTTRWEPIEGGNHAQFGWYGPQAGDNAATITPEAQQAQTVVATVALLEALK